MERLVITSQDFDFERNIIKNLSKIDSKYIVLINSDLFLKNILFENKLNFDDRLLSQLSQSKSNPGVFFENCIFNEEVLIDAHMYSFQITGKCDFKKNLNIKSNKISLGLEILNSEFKGELCISEYQLTNNQISIMRNKIKVLILIFNSSPPPLYIEENIKIDLLEIISLNSLKIGEINCQSNLEINNFILKSQVRTLNLEDNKLIKIFRFLETIDEINIVNTKINKLSSNQTKIYLSSNGFGGGINSLNVLNKAEIENLDIALYENMGSNNFPRIRIEKSKIKNKVKFDFFKKIKVPFNLLISNSLIGSYLETEKDYKEFKIEKSSITNLKLVKCKFMENINIISSLKKYNAIDNFTFEYNAIGKDFDIEYLKTDNFTFNHNKDESSSEIIFNEIIIKEDFSIKNFRNKGFLKISHLNTNGNFSPKKKRQDYFPTFHRFYGIQSDSGLFKLANFFYIFNSSLDNCEFQNINLKSFEKTIISSSDLDSVKFIDMRWMEKLSSDENNKRLENPYEEILRERSAYRTLKQSMLNQNDKIQALEFYSKEMETYSRYIKNYRDNHIKVYRIDKNYKEYFKNFFQYKFPERLLLSINQFTNNYGLSWVRPLFLILGLNFLCLLFYLFLGASFIGAGLFPSIFILSYPLTHINTIVKTPDWSSLILVFDILRRTFVSVLIYQTIQGFRKYSRNI